MPPLTPRQRFFRVAIIACAALALALPICKTLLPSFPSLPCGFKALTGLPCLLCGGTRSACAALNGHFEYSLYLNALALPAIAVTTLAAAICLLEILRGSPVAQWERLRPLFRKISPILLVLLLVWWSVHITTALRIPKPELVNPEKPIPAFLHKWLRP